MTARDGLTAAALAAVLAGCQGAPPATAPAPTAAAIATDPVPDARAAMARGDWAAAASHLRAALSREPERLELHYRLAITASYLDAPEEATREFEWVERHAAHGSEEATVARGWLASPASGTRRTARRDDAATTIEVAPPTGSLSGVVLWAEPQARPQPRNRQLVMLVGLPGTPTKGTRYRVRADQDGRYIFRNVPAGPYELTDAIAGPATWRQRVVVEPGRESIVDLSRDNSVAFRDDFPQGVAASSPTPPGTAPRAEGAIPEKVAKSP